MPEEGTDKAVQEPVVDEPAADTPDESEGATDAEPSADDLFEQLFEAVGTGPSAAPAPSEEPATSTTPTVATAVADTEEAPAWAQRLTHEVSMLRSDTERFAQSARNKELRSDQERIDNAVAAFKASHKDYAVIEPKLQSVLATLAKWSGVSPEKKLQIAHQLVQGAAKATPPSRRATSSERATSGRSSAKADPTDGMSPEATTKAWVEANAHMFGK